MNPCPKCGFTEPDLLTFIKRNWPVILDKDHPSYEFINFRFRSEFFINIYIRGWSGIGDYICCYLTKEPGFNQTSLNKNFTILGTSLQTKKGCKTHEDLYNWIKKVAYGNK